MNASDSIELCQESASASPRGTTPLSAVCPSLAQCIPLHSSAVSFLIPTPFPLGSLCSVCSVLLLSPLQYAYLRLHPFLSPPFLWCQLWAECELTISMTVLTAWVSILILLMKCWFCRLPDKQASTDNCFLLLRAGDTCFCKLALSSETNLLL